MNLTELKGRIMLLSDHPHAASVLRRTCLPLQAARGAKNLRASGGCSSAISTA